MCNSCEGVFTDEQKAEHLVKAREAVQEGVSLLNEHGPADWRSVIDRDRLDMGSSYDCVLGQVYGGYYDGLDALSEKAGRYISETEYGFMNSKTYDHERDEYDYEFTYDALKEAWLEKLSKENVPA